MVHHSRRLSRDLTEWQPDSTALVTAPAIAISKPPDIHTTQAVSAGGRRADDFFRRRGGTLQHRRHGRQPRRVPDTGAGPQSYAGVVTSRADDPRAALNRTPAPA